MPTLPALPSPSTPPHTLPHPPHTPQVRKYLEHQLARLQRPVDLDEAHRAALDQSEQQYRGTMFDAYRRCLLAGGQYDVQVVYRLCHLWFELRADEGVNAALEQILSQVHGVCWGGWL